MAQVRSAQASNHLRAISAPLMIDDAHQYCLLLRNGKTEQQATQELQSSYGVTPTEASVISGAALVVYPTCYP